jgi:uncharacterized integral membrane protein
MVWTMVGIGVVLLVAILLFILQNGQRVRVRFLMVNGTLQLGLPEGTGAPWKATTGTTLTARRRVRRRVHAARRYSWSRPPSRSRRYTLLP